VFSFRPAPHRPRLPEAAIPSAYGRYRWQVMLTIFVGYASFYLVRSNFANAKPYLERDLGFTKSDIGLIAGMLSISYGLSKFVMGVVSDRSNPRYFMASGLILSGAANLLMGAWPSAYAMAALWFMNGWFQGMGWPPCGRTLTHWFSDNERGTKFAIWNTAHNVGGGVIGPIATFAIMAWASWRGAFVLPGLIAIVMGFVIMAFLRDTPQSVGLPPIEEHRDDYPAVAVEDREREIDSKEILVRFVLKNGRLWVIAIANVFVYAVRYGVLNWAPSYLQQVKHASLKQAGWFYFAFEIAGIFGTIVAGWVSDRLFAGRRGPISVIYMVIVTCAVVAYWLNPSKGLAIDFAALFVIGTFIYGPVMLIGVAAVDLVPKKAAGSAAGFTGLFGYLAGMNLAEVGIGSLVERYGWNAGFILLTGACLAATACLATTWNMHDRRAHGS
jgi:OPA family glycerol-3-phosphate transporter-like MFS transporter